MKKTVLFAAVVAAVGVTAAEASATGHGPVPGGSAPRPFAGLFARRPVPAIQAAPWYLYWPYNAHFQTPAPLTGPYYAPPYTGGALVNPYFPGAGGYGGAYPVPASSAPAAPGGYVPYAAPGSSTTPAPLPTTPPASMPSTTLPPSVVSPPSVPQ